MIHLPRRDVLGFAGLIASSLAVARAGVAGRIAPLGTPFNIRDFGAVGNGSALDTAAINRAIQAAARAGGGTVWVPAGHYLCFSLHLESHVRIILDAGAVLIAADPARHGGSYDAPEPNPSAFYQDFGHSHWHNSLIWGEGIEDVAILGPGKIDGAGLTREGPGSPFSRGAEGDRPLSMGPAPASSDDGYAAACANMVGRGNKAIALKNVRGVTLRDFTIFRGGHFAILATGVDNLTIDNLKIDTNRDGIDLDVVRNARLSNLIVNTPNDDGIVLKSSLALGGAARPTENVIVTGCHVSGYDLGSLLDGSFRKTQACAPDGDGVTGRIKLGTESNGGYRNIAISGCVFDRCRGLALESVDGGVMEEISVDNIVMRDVTTAPLFVCTGDRRRAPAGTPMAVSRRISISNLTATGIDRRYAALVAGLPDSPVEDVSLENLRLEFLGGGTAKDAARTLPDVARAYPEPSMFGVTPAWGLYLRHVRGARLHDVELHARADDARPAVAQDDVTELRCSGVCAAIDPDPLRPILF